MSGLGTAALALAFAVAGAVAGWVYFHLLKFSLRFLEPGHRSTAWFAALAIGRLALFAAGGAAALFLGIWSLAAYTAAFLIVRTVIVARVRTEPAEAAREKGEANG
jgi:hypothetical protein